MITGPDEAAPTPCMPEDVPLLDMSAYSRYGRAAHAMQTAIAVELAHDPSCGTPKSLRVGVNVALADHAALVRLLVTAGVITASDYQDAVARMMEQEAERCANVARAAAKLPDTVAFV